MVSFSPPFALDTDAEVRLCFREILIVESVVLVQDVI